MNLSALSPSGAWCHWGSAGTSDGVPTCGRAAGGRVGQLKISGGHALQIKTYDNNPTVFAWDDGSPVPSATADAGGVFAYPTVMGSAFVLPITLPSSEAGPAQVRLFAGVYCGTATVRVWDGAHRTVLFSANFSSPAVPGVAGIGDADITLTVRTGISHLQLEWTLDTNTACRETAGNLEFQAVAFI
mmetsp:Transcript_6220/g.18563  ORF Transcript_6220/g.18563 Transcript_6220/m.18563 type:complete len:187 (-) Transcript_6220:2168-2728(-)